METTKTNNMPLLKNHTKFKIIKWVERVLRYQPEPIRPFIEKQRTIRTLKWEIIVCQSEFLSGSYKIKMNTAFAEALQEFKVAETIIMEELLSPPYFEGTQRKVRIQGRLHYVTPEKN